MKNFTIVALICLLSPIVSAVEFEGNEMAAFLMKTLENSHSQRFTQVKKVNDFPPHYEIEDSLDGSFISCKEVPLGSLTLAFSTQCTMDVYSRINGTYIAALLMQGLEDDFQSEYSRVQKLGNNSYLLEDQIGGGSISCKYQSMEMLTPAFKTICEINL